MNMKRLIAESEFDNLEELSKKWKKPEESRRTLPEQPAENTTLQQTMTVVGSSMDFISRKEKENVIQNNLTHTTTSKAKPRGFDESKLEEQMELDYRKLLQKTKNQNRLDSSQQKSQQSNNHFTEVTQSRVAGGNETPAMIASSTFTKQTDSAHSARGLEYSKYVEAQKKIASHVPQIIDQDTEQFKVRLQHLLNVFKTDAIGEFMSMKRTILEDQKEQVKLDTEKYLRLYEEKHKELTETREALLAKSNECEIKSLRCEKMAAMIAKQMEKTRVVRCLTNPFSMLVRYKEYRQIKKFKEKQAEKSNNRRLLNKGMNGWLKVFREESKIRKKEEEEKRLQHQMTEIGNKYHKQIQMLREKLAETTAKLDEHESHKATLQDNLKKAFMRGVCAMNFEAMNAIQGQTGQDFLRSEQMFTNNSKVEQLINVGMNNSMNPMINNSMMSFGRPPAAAHIQPMATSTYMNQSSMQGTASKNIVYLSQPKIESKDHRWREAPVVTAVQARQDEDLQPIPTIPEAVVDFQEGKVIRVVNGKSTTVKPTIPQGTSIGNSRRTTGTGGTVSSSSSTMGATKKRP